MCSYWLGKEYVYKEGKKVTLNDIYVGRFGRQNELIVLGQTFV